MQMCVNTKKNLLGLRPLWAVVLTRLLGMCRVLGIYHIARLLLFGSLAITHGISRALGIYTPVDQQDSRGRGRRRLVEQPYRRRCASWLTTYASARIIRVRMPKFFLGGRLKPTGLIK